MNTNVTNFLNSLENPNTIRVVGSVLKNIGENENIEQYNAEELEEFILNLKPNSPKGIITIVYVLSLYAKFLAALNLVDSDDFHQAIQQLDKNAIWKKAKPNAPAKFISYSEYKEVLHDIAMYEEFNSLYYETLTQSLFEGIYCDDMSIIKNLRAADIIDETTMLLRRDDGTSYEFQVTPDLIRKLKTLSTTYTWKRNNRNGVCNIAIQGDDFDTCFKLEKRKAAKEDSYKFSYYSRIRKVSKDYFERSILPFSIYVSGIMYRIGRELQHNNITLEEAFSENNRNRVVGSIISAELQRCHYDIEVRNFREIVKGHIDTFSDRSR